MQILSTGDNLCEMSKPVLLYKIRIISVCQLFIILPRVLSIKFIQFISAQYILLISCHLWHFKRYKKAEHINSSFFVNCKFISSVSSLSFLFFFLSCLSFSSPLLSLFSLSLRDDTKWPTRVDVSLNSNTIKIKNVSCHYTHYLGLCEQILHTMPMLILKVSNNHPQINLCYVIDFSCFSEKNKAWHFMWIICIADN